MTGKNSGKLRKLRKLKKSDLEKYIQNYNLMKIDRSSTKMKMLRKIEKHLSVLLDEDTSNNTVAECHDTDANNSNFEIDDGSYTSDDADDLVETAIAFHDD